MILAVGTARVPVMPDWPGAGTLTGRLRHASRYRSAEEFAGKRVLVVGSDNSGAEMAGRLAEHAEVTVSIRTPPHILPKSVFGLPLAGIGVMTRHLPRSCVDALLGGLQRGAVGDLSAHGLPYPPTPRSRRFARTSDRRCTRLSRATFGWDASGWSQR